MILWLLFSISIVEWLFVAQTWWLENSPSLSYLWSFLVHYSWYTNWAKYSPLPYLDCVLLKVPALEHNGRIIGESLDLVKYVDANFKGLALLPDVRDESWKYLGSEELTTYSCTFLDKVYVSFEGDPVKQAGNLSCLDSISLHESIFFLLQVLNLITWNKFDDGPFFLYQFSQVSDFSFARPRQDI